MNDILATIWERADAREPRFSGDEVAAWDDGLIGRLEASELIRQVESATSVVCDACAEEHTEEVTYIESPHRSPVRAYIPCPENGRVNVPLERLRQWEVDFGGIAAVLNGVLELAGGVEEVVPGQIWFLGKATVAARSRELFLARGLTWEDARGVLGASARFNAARSAIVLVAGDVPPEDVWSGNAPPVVALKTIVEWTGRGIAIDRGHLESLLSTGRKKAAAVPLVSFPTPDGTGWPDVRITITEDTLSIEAKGKRRRYTFQEAGFKDRRTKGVPDRLWRLLKAFGVHGGVLPFKNAKTEARTNVKQYVSDLRQRLAALLPGIEGESIVYEKKDKSFHTAFKVSCEDALQFHTSLGASWTDISIAKDGGGRIRISVSSTERFAASGFADEDDESTHRWEAAEREGVVERTYDLRTLKLADDRDRPNRAGQALLDVLSGKGATGRKADDKGMLDLCGVLTRLMGIDESPFEFDRIDGKWVALFDIPDSA